MSDAIDCRDGAPQGTALLPADLSKAQLEAAPVPPPEIKRLLADALPDVEERAGATNGARS